MGEGRSQGGQYPRGVNIEVAKLRLSPTVPTMFGIQSPFSAGRGATTSTAADRLNSVEQGNACLPNIISFGSDCSLAPNRL